MSPKCDRLVEDVLAVCEEIATVRRREAELIADRDGLVRDLWAATRGDGLSYLRLEWHLGGHLRESNIRRIIETGSRVPH